MAPNPFALLEGDHSDSDDIAAIATAAAAKRSAAPPPPKPQREVKPPSALSDGSRALGRSGYRSRSGHEGAALEEKEKAGDGFSETLSTATQDLQINGNRLQEKYKNKNVNGSKRRKAYKENKKKKEAASVDDSSEKKAEDASEEKAVSVVASSKSTVPEDPEEKNKTLAEYEKELEEKRKELMTMKPEVRRVESKEQFEGMEAVGRKKKEEEGKQYIKLKSDKEKLKSKHEDEEKTKEAPKPMKITEFLKDYNGGEGKRAGYNGGRPQKGTITGKADASLIAMEDPAQFPELKASEVPKA